MDTPQSDATSYNFAIQASNPCHLAVMDTEDESLGAAIQTVFPMENEYAFIIWNWVYVPISYKYDLSLMIEDVMELEELMLSKCAGSHTIYWPSNSFAAVWSIEWNEGMATLRAEWTSVLGGVESLLGASPTVLLSITAFIREWKRPLEVIFRALVAAGYTPEGLGGMKRLSELIEKIDRRGVLYGCTGLQQRTG